MLGWWYWKLTWRSPKILEKSSWGNHKNKNVRQRKIAQDRKVTIGKLKWVGILAVGQSENEKKVRERLNNKNGENKERTRIWIWGISASSHSEIQKAASKAIFLRIDYARFQRQDIDSLMWTLLMLSWNSKTHFRRHFFPQVSEGGKAL